MKIKMIDFGLEFEPKRAHAADAGADVYAHDNFIIKPHETVKIPLGFGLELPDGLAGLVIPRSSMAAKGIIAQIPPVDSTYRGNIHAIITNTTNDEYEVKKGDRVAQLVIFPIVIADFVKDFNEEERGEGAFGSTGR